MSTKINEMRLSGWLVVLVLAVCVFALPQRAGAVCDLWSESSDVLSPIDGNDCVDANNFTALDDVEAAKFHTTGCTVSGTKTVAFGNGTTASGDYSAAFGDGAQALQSGSFAVGIAEDEFDVNGLGSIGMGWAMEVDNASKFRTDNDGAIAIGYSRGGSEFYSQGKGSVALGYVWSAGDLMSTGAGSLAAGWAKEDYIYSTGRGSVAMGCNHIGSGPLRATADGAIAIGCGDKYDDNDYGNGPDALGRGSIALGLSDSEAKQDGSVVIGEDLIADAANAFALGKKFTNDEANSFAVGFGDIDFHVTSSSNVTVYGDLEVTGTMTPTLVEPNEKEVFFKATRTNTYGDFQVRGIVGAGAYNLTGHVPFDFVSLTSLKAIFIVASGAAQANRHFHLESDYATQGEVYTNHQETDNTIYVDLTGYTDKLYGLDISSVVDAGALAAGDLIGVKVNHQALGGGLKYLGMLMQYKGNW